jgi:hypothetical protein
MAPDISQNALNQNGDSCNYQEISLFNGGSHDA